MAVALASVLVLAASAASRWSQAAPSAPAPDAPGAGEAPSSPSTAGGAEASASGDGTAGSGAGDESQEQDELDAHLLFLGGVGLVAMPFAELCPVVGQPCEPAETGIELSLGVLGRISDFGFGGGISWAAGLRPTTVAGDASLERSHSRSYLLVRGSFRYYLPRISVWDWWLGAHAGGAVINDSWSTLADREPGADTDFVGPRAVTLRTEGLDLGVGAGVSWRFAEHFVFGTQFSYANWILPAARAQTPLGDLASLAGRIDVLEVGGRIGVILPL